MMMPNADTMLRLPSQVVRYISWEKGRTVISAFVITPFIPVYLSDSWCMDVKQYQQMMMQPNEKLIRLEPVMTSLMLEDASLKMHRSIWTRLKNADFMHERITSLSAIISKHWLLAILEYKYNMLQYNYKQKYR